MAAVATHPRIARRLSPAHRATVDALTVAYGPRFGATAVEDCIALFADALVPAEPGSSIRVHRFPPRRALDLARRCMEEASRGGDLAQTAAGTLFVLAQRGEGQ